MKLFFSPDNIVNIILFAAGYVISAIYAYWRNRRGRWIIVEKTAENLIFAKPPEMNGERAIEILAEKRPINSLVQTVFLIKNTGADIVDQIQVTLDFIKQETGEKFQVIGVKAKEEYFVFTLDSLLFRKSFLNSSHAYDETIKILVYSEHPISLKVKGSGIGWKAKYIDKIQRQTKIKQVFIESFLSASGLEKISTKRSNKQNDTDDDDNSWLSLV